ncbi:penicillin-binding transpeptidase domain-containing protein [uncultured Neglectibacter sp.]|uniref:penicillin-binding transpeptidase domain-containing protein n=1 Tax=uncultured Neglectibacter sp. TaxID=1924108 RepID=UPI0034DE935E
MKLPKLKKPGRYAFCILLLLAVCLLYVGRLFQWQVINGEYYRQEALNDRTDTIELDAARGQILDRNGKVLAGNRVSYDIVYNALNMVYEERNATIIKVVELLEERNEKWRDRLPIILNEENEYQFAEGRESEIETLKGQDMLNMAEYATAEECMGELARRYGCEGFSKKDIRDVASVRYSMERDGYSRTNAYVIAADVSSETVGVISQRAGELKGVEPRVSVARYYGEDGSLAPHVVGHVGSISGEEYDEAVKNGTAYDYKDNISGYKWTDSLGRGGIESAFEDDLRGSRGEETIFVDDTGEVKNTAVTVPPKEGNTVYTTLDTDLQRVANLSLKKNIEGNKNAKDCTAGAAVVLDVKNFGVLVNSSYPTFDMNLYTSDDNYVRQKEGDTDGQPMLNRALDGVYTPGSVFKPMVALAALQEGVITADTTYFCDKLYTLGDDPLTALHLKCTDYHGNTNVYSGLAGSCNVFFCNVGLNLTIKKMDAYAQYFGLGEETGVELGEATGTMSNPQEFKENHGGEEWVDGNTAQTAIGQMDNMFTPIQLATYCATIANGGKRLETHFLDKVTDYSGEETVRTHQKKELFDADLSSDVLGVVKEGMRMVATSGTASDVFGDYPVSIACKTGTAETSMDDSTGTEPNISFICYAPADDPQIAIAVMLEYGNKGPYAQNVAKDILDQYFGFYTWDEDGNRYDSSGNLVDDEGKVLKTKEQLDAEKAQQEEQEKEDFLSSALENGADDTASSGTDMTSSQPAADDGGNDRREDIPNTPFTGETSSAPESSPSSAGEDTSSSSGTASSGSGRKPDSPYYTGSKMVGKKLRSRCDRFCRAKPLFS